MDLLLTFFVGAWGGVAGAVAYLEYRSWRHRRLMARVSAQMVAADPKDFP